MFKAHGIKSTENRHGRREGARSLPEEIKSYFTLHRLRSGEEHSYLQKDLILFLSLIDFGTENKTQQATL